MAEILALVIVLLAIGVATAIWLRGRRRGGVIAAPPSEARRREHPEEN